MVLQEYSMDKMVEDAFAAIGRGDGDDITLAGLLKPVLFGLLKGINPNSEDQAIIEL